jgi:hypothetical protein
MELSQPVVVAMLIFAFTLVYMLTRGDDKKVKEETKSSTDQKPTEQGCLVTYIGKIATYFNSPRVLFAIMLYL